jgi:hypothetical protein
MASTVKLLLQNFQLHHSIQNFIWLFKQDKIVTKTSLVKGFYSFREM